MEKVKRESTTYSKPTKREINWAEYLDYTEFPEPGEINNESLKQFKKDFKTQKQ